MKNKTLISKKTFWRHGSFKFPLSNALKYLFKANAKPDSEISMSSILDQTRSTTSYLHYLYSEDNLIQSHVKTEPTTEKQTEANLISAGIFC